MSTKRKNSNSKINTNKGMPKHSNYSINEQADEAVAPKRKHKKRHKGNRKKKLTPGQIVSRILMVIGVTILSILIFVLGALFILLKGPSTEATKIFTLSCHETSAIKWLPKIFLSDEEYDAILNPVIERDDFVPLPKGGYIQSPNQLSENDTDTNAEITVTKPIEIIDLKGATYKGKLMIVHDPSKVIFGSIDSFGGAGLTLSAFLNKYDAIGCTNAGGFEDEGGTGKGGIPDGIVIRDGQIVYGSAGGSYSGFAGFDAENKLHVGSVTGQQALNMGIVSGTNFKGGPVLIQDGVRQTGFVSGINPRTAIGQTADGTVLLIAVEGRLADSLGATFDDLADVMLSYGAINAVNMDGGSSSGMYYEGERLTRSSSVVGDRPLPTAIMVLK